MSTSPSESATTTNGHRVGDAVVTCVVVTYNPDRFRLQQLLDAVLPQVRDVLLIDNGSRTAQLDWLRALSDPRLRLVELGSNKGIAAAMNVGIARARNAGCTHLLLLDHDSVECSGAEGVVLRGYKGVSHASVAEGWLVQYRRHGRFAQTA